MYRLQTQAPPAVAGALHGDDQREEGLGEVFGLLEMLEAAIRDDSMIRICYLLEQLSVAVQEHFAREERQMRRTGFPEVAEHVREHRAFTNEVYRVRLVYLDRSLAPQTVAALKDSLSRHVVESDSRHAAWRARNGRRQEACVMTFMPSPERDAGVAAGSC